MKKAFFIVLGLAITLILADSLLLGVEHKSWLFPHIDTRFAKDFSFDKWDKVRVGMNKENVLKTLGTPIGETKDKMSTARPPCADIEMHYSSDGAWGISDFAWESFIVFLDSNNVVIAKSREWYFD